MSQSSPLRKEVTLLATTWALLLAAAAASTSGLDTAAYSASFCGSGFQSSQSNCVSARAGPATAPALVREYGPAGYGANLLLLADDTLLTLNSDNNNCLLTMYPQGAVQAAWTYDVRPPCSRLLMTNSGLVISLGGDAVRAHQLATGSVVWSYQIAAYGQSDGLVLSGNKVIAHRYATVLCLDADSGGLTWSTTLSGDNGGSNSEWNPVLDAAGNIFVVTASKVRRLSAATGSVEWAVDLGSLNNRQGGLYSATTNTIFAGGGGALFALDGSTGAERWRLAMGLHQWLSQSVEINGVLYFSYQNTNNAYFLRAVNIASGTLLWTKDSEGDQWWSLSASTFGGGTLFVGTDAGEVRALDPGTGTELWNVTLPRISWIRAPIVIGPAGKLYVSAWAFAVYVYQVLPTSTATPTSTASASASGTASGTSSSTSTASGTASASPTSTASSTSSASPSGTASGTVSSTVSSTASAVSASPTASFSSTSTASGLGAVAVQGAGSTPQQLDTTGYVLVFVGVALVIAALATVVCAFTRQRAAIAPAKPRSSDASSASRATGDSDASSGGDEGGGAAAAEARSGPGAGKIMCACVCKI